MADIVKQPPITSHALLWAFIALIAGLGIWASKSPIAGAGDVRVHVRSAHVFFMGITDELAYPDWDATAYGGRGTPSLRYIGPLPLLISSIFQLLGLTAAMAVKLTVVTFALAGLFGLKMLLHSMDKLSAFPWISLFFLLQPAIGFNLGVVFLFQNICAHLLSPWLLYHLHRYLSGNRRSAISCAIFMALSAWTHSPYTLMLGYAWLIFSFAGLIWFRSREFVVLLLLVPLLAAALAAPYALPVVLTKSDVYYEITQAYLQPGELHCEFLNDPVLEKTGANLSFFSALALMTKENERNPDVSILQTISWEDRNNFARPWQLLLVVSAFLLSIVALYRSWLAKGVMPWQWALAGGFCAFMTLSWSRLFYAILPGVADLQFPFRWVLPAICFWTPLAAIAVAADDKPNKSYSWSARCAWVSRIILIVFIGAGFWLQGLFWQLPESSLQAFFANPGQLQPFYPRSVPDPKEIPTLADDPHNMFIASGTVAVANFESGIAWVRCKIEAEEHSVVNMNTHYDNYWRVSLSGKMAEIYPAENDGTILLDVPKGVWELQMWRTPPAGRTIGWVIMLMALGYILWTEITMKDDHDECENIEQVA